MCIPIAGRPRGGTITIAKIFVRKRGLGVMYQLRTGMLLLSDRCNILQATSDRSKQYVYQFWEQSVDNWTFYKLISIFHKFICITTITHKIVNIFIWPWLLTFIWPWLWVWPLTLTILRKYSFSIFSFFSKSRDVKTWRRTSKRRDAYRSAIL